MINLLPILDDMFKDLIGALAKNKEKSPAEFAYLLKNVWRWESLRQGKAVEDFISKITGWPLIAEDGKSIASVGHKGDVQYNWGGTLHYPNVKSTMCANLFKKTSAYEMYSGLTVKIFDSSRSKSFDLVEAIKQIRCDMPIVHFAWDIIKHKGCVSVTSLMEIADNSKIPKWPIEWHPAHAIAAILKSNHAGHHLLKAHYIYDTARHHKRVRHFKLRGKSLDDACQKYDNVIEPTPYDYIK